MLVEDKHTHTHTIAAFTLYARGGDAFIRTHAYENTKLRRVVFVCWHTHSMLLCYKSHAVIDRERTHTHMIKRSQVFAPLSHTTHTTPHNTSSAKRARTPIPPKPQAPRERSEQAIRWRVWRAMIARIVTIISRRRDTPSRCVCVCNVVGLVRITCTDMVTKRTVRIV